MSLGITACGDSSAKMWRKSQQIALLECADKNFKAFQLVLLSDSTFVISMKNNRLAPSRGNFEFKYGRYYFYTTAGDDRLCDFYYLDTARKMFWANKGCGDKPNLSILTWN